MSGPEPDRDDATLKALFHAFPGEAPHSPDDVDAVFLEQLGARSLAEFEDVPPVATVDERPVTNTTLTNPPQPLPLGQSRRSPTMLTMLFRSLLALSAAVAGVAVWLSSSPESLNAAPFSKVLDRLASVDSMQLRLVSQGQNVDVWVRSPGQVRIDDAPTRYRIARGGSVWQIDEQANTLVAAEAGHRQRLFTGKDNSDFNLAALLELCLPDLDTGKSSGDKTSKSVDLRDLIPVRRLIHEGRDCVLYQTEFAGAGGDRPAKLEAIADAKSFELLSFVVHEERVAGDNVKDVPAVELRLIAMNVPVDESKFVLATTLSDDGRVGKVTDVQGIAGLRPLNAQRWTCTRRDLIVKPGDWIRTELRGANAVAVSLTSQTQLVIGPGSLVEVLSPTQVRLHSGEMQVAQPGAVPGAKPVDKGAESKPADDQAAPAKPAAPIKIIPLVVLAPQTGSHTFDQPGKQLVRVTRDETLLVSAKVDAEAPMWLKGFEGATSNESLGSLIVKLPDGRSAPLAVGVHLVSVDIRDQIARTTIEETFVNNTGTRLEGVFHFPLPQEASISGFGMWIGNQLVEADIVEKQRAREIYETILSEKRDPGLLEWTGGNIFSARVFPIEPHSEKRVKIVYTQVLPLRANTYRYNYGLRSELLQTRPLRELGLTVTVQSAIPLKQVKCSSHPARVQQTATSGRVEYVAQEVTPTRDFEVVCEIDGRQSDVVMIPHRRGDDGYFLLQLTPPAPAGNWQREVLPEGKPLDLLLLCDTSGSMDKEKRKQQSACVATLLAALGPADRFNLATVDVRPEWLFDKAVAASEQSLTRVSQTLDGRASLGWTDLDKAFASAAIRATATSQIIYIGDGIVSTVESDPQAFLKRMAELNKGNVDGKPATVHPIHCIGVGNSFESVVLQGISRMTRGSTRMISGELTPQVVTLELLNEIAQPGLSDITVEYRGIKVAAVYPNKLPNVAAGTQQILVGRYLPEAQRQTGEVIITAKRGGETVRYATKVTLPERRLDSPASQAALKNDAKPGSNPLPRETAPDDDASFIPRLWARGRLDELLHQGSSSQVRDEIIALSEEFHIITPYTSLLVLETDQDRERFGVKRRFEMRDGERFFAEGRSLANEELRQKQLRQAAGYRNEIRQRILQELAKLGRQPLNWHPQALEKLQKAMAPGGMPMAGAEFLGDDLRDLDALARLDDGGKFQIWDSEPGMSGAYGRVTRDEWDYKRMSDSAPNGPWGGYGGFGGGAWGPSDKRFAGDRGGIESDWEEDGFERFAGRKSGVYRQLRDESTLDFVDVSGAFGPAPDGELPFEPDSVLSLKDSLSNGMLRASSRSMGMGFGFGAGGRISAQNAFWDNPYLSFEPKSRRGYDQYAQQGNPQQYIQWYNTLFPILSPVPSRQSANWLRQREERLDRESKWSPEAIALSNSLLRRTALAKMEGGLEITRTTESFDPRWSRMSGRSQRLELYSPQAWLTRPMGTGNIVVNWSNAVERGVFSQAFQVGRIRSAVEADREELPLELDDWSLSPIHRSYRAQSARIEPAGDGQATLIVVFQNPQPDDDDAPAGPTHEYRVLIDTARHVVLKSQEVREGTASYTKTFGEFVEVAGQWWPQTSAVVDSTGRKTSETRQKITLLATEPFQQRLNAELADRSKVLFAGESTLQRKPQPGTDPKSIKRPGTSVADARQRVADGTATTDDRLLLILSECTKQNLAAAIAQVDALEALAADKPGTRWVRAYVWQALRDNDLLRKRLLQEARQLAAEPQTDVARNNEQFLAETVRGMTYSATGYPEYLELLTIIRPVYERQPEHVLALHDWLGHQAGCFQALNRLDEELAVLKRLATEAPWNVHHHTQYAQRLEARGDRIAADAWIRQQIDRRVADGLPRAGQPVEWQDYERQQLFQHQANVFHQRGEFQRLVTWSAEWAERMPTTPIAYSQWLSALIFNDQYPEAVRLAKQWMNEGIDGTELTSVKRTRFDVATEFALGRCHNLSMQEIDPTWHQKLPEAARAFLHQRRNFEIGRSLFGQMDGRDFDEVDALRLSIFKKLVREAATLDPTRLASFVQWSLTGRMKFPLGEKPAADDLAFFREVDLQAMQARPMSADAINAAWKSLGDRCEFESSEIPNPIWIEIAKVIRLRWETEQKPNRKLQLGETLLNVYRYRMTDRRLPFLRDLLAVADDDHRPAAALALFDALLGEPWTDAIETELFTLLPRLAPKPTLLKTKEANRGELAMRVVPQLLRLVDALVASREAATNRELLDGGKSHELTRTELAAKRASAKQEARQGVADRLTSELKAQPNAADDVQTTLLPWLEIEALTLNVQLGRGLDEVTAACWKIVEPNGPEAKPADAKPADDDEDLDEDDVAVRIDAGMRSVVHTQLKERAFSLLMHLAVRKSAPAADVDRILKFIDGRLAQAETLRTPKAGTDQPPAVVKPNAEKKDATTDDAEQPAVSTAVRKLRTLKFRMLVALDRPEELERQLRSWIASEKSLTPWRVTLGWLQAERGGLPEAVQVFEAAQKDGLLGPREIRALADWYLVLDRRDDHRRMQLAVHMLRSEHELYQLLAQRRNQFQQPTSSTELDDETLLMIEALLKKSTSPESYFWVIRELYTATRDFRVLAALPDASLGRSPQQAYTYLNAVRTQLLTEVRNEATIDPIITRLRTLRDAPVKPGASDRDVTRDTELRALDLLEALVESQAANVLNQPGPHITAAVAAMQRAFERKWSDGEPRLMANHLYNLGRMPHQPLIDEQIRELKALAQQVPAGSGDWLHVEWSRALLLHQYYAQSDEAESQMDAAVRLYLAEHADKWHSEDQDVLAGWIGLLTDRQHYAKGETLIAERRAKPFNDQQLPWLKEQWYGLQLHALSKSGETSLGKGGTLLKKIADLQLADIRATQDANHRYNLLIRMPSTYQTAHNAQIKEAAGLLREYAFQVLPDVMKSQLVNYSSVINHTASALEQVLGPRDAVWWLAERIETYPKRLEYMWENPWSQHGHTLGQYRRNCVDKGIALGDAEPVLLKIVLAELRRELTTRRQRYTSIARNHNHHFWTEKSADFARVAEEVLAANRNSGRVQRYVAEYQYSGLSLPNRAIEILFAARKQGLLDASGESVLISYLMAQSRFGEAIAFLEPLVKSFPNALGHRTELMRAYHGTQRLQQLRDLLTETDAHFHKGGRWTEGAMAELARACENTGLALESTKYYTEAISYHQRHAPGRGIGDNTLWGYYHQLAHQYINLHQTREAVDAAASGLICFPPSHHLREQTMNTLRQALQQSPDLKAYIQFLDERAKSDRQDSALLRKSLGRVFKEKGQLEPAITQFKLALELQPLDQETQQWLMESLDGVGRKDEATVLLLARIDLERHNLELYKQLALRLKDDEVQAERAATSMVEAAPNDANHHAALAEWREQQNRWDEALQHWQQFIKQRRLDPTGLVRLAKVQLKLNQTPAARETLKQLESTTWPPRYNTIPEDIRQLKEKLR